MASKCFVVRLAFQLEDPFPDGTARVITLATSGERGPRHEVTGTKMVAMPTRYVWTWRSTQDTTEVHREHQRMARAARKDVGLAKVVHSRSVPLPSQREEAVELLPQAPRPNPGRQPGIGTDSASGRGRV